MLNVRILRFVLSLLFLALPVEPVFCGNNSVLDISKGLEQPLQGQPLNVNKKNNDEFIPFSKAFKKDGDFLVLTVPNEGSTQCYRYTGIGPFPVKPMRRYCLSFKSNLCQGEFTPMFSATYFLKEPQPPVFHYLYNLYKDVHYTTRMMLREWEFATPESAENMVFWIGVSGLGKRVEPGKKTVFQDLAILERGPMNGTAETRPLAGRNLLPFSDFEDQPLGPFDPDQNIFNTCKNLNLSAEVVQRDSKCLHIVKGEKGYTFPHFMTKQINFNNCWTEFSCRIRGKGTVKLGIWWRLKAVHYDYEHSPELITLTDQWQTVRARRYCVDPTTEYAACSITTQSPEVDMEVDDIALKIILP